MKNIVRKIISTLSALVVFVLLISFILPNISFAQEPSVIQGDALCQLESFRSITFQNTYYDNLVFGLPRSSPSFSIYNINEKNFSQNIELAITVKDNDWYDLYIDGSPLIESNTTTKRVYLDKDTQKTVTISLIVGLGETYYYLPQGYVGIHELSFYRNENTPYCTIQYEVEEAYAVSPTPTAIPTPTAAPTTNFYMCLVKTAPSEVNPDLFAKGNASVDINATMYIKSNHVDQMYRDIKSSNTTLLWRKSIDYLQSLNLENQINPVTLLKNLLEQSNTTEELYNNINDLFFLDSDYRKDFLKIVQREIASLVADNIEFHIEVRDGNTIETIDDPAVTVSVKTRSLAGTNFYNYLVEVEKGLSILSDKYSQGHEYSIELKEKRIQKGTLDMCSESKFSIGNPPPTHTPVPSSTPTKTPEEEELEELALVCSNISEEEDKDQYEKCLDCVGRPKYDDDGRMTGEFEPGSGTWTALGCLPTDPTVFLRDYFFTIGLGLAGGIAFLLMLWGSFSIIISGGDPQRVAHGREIILSAIAGFLLIIFSILILQIIGLDIFKLPGFAKTQCELEGGYCSATVDCGGNKETEKGCENETICCKNNTD